MGTIKAILKFGHKQVLMLLMRFSPILASKYLYAVLFGKGLNIKKPNNFNEKLQWLKLFDQNPLKTQCTDKYEVRFFVEGLGYKKILNELYAVYNVAEEVKWDELPERFVLKTTNGCGSNIICKSKKDLDKEEATRKLNKWLKTDFGRYSAELHYSKIKPRIICEKFLSDETGQLPRDYKIYCFNGKPELVLIISDRGKKIKLDFLTLDWERLSIGKPEFESAQLPAKPASFEKMVEYAEQLSAPFPFVRVDFYDINGQPIFGEMTFTPAAGVATYYNDYGLKDLGDLLDIDGYIKNKTNLG